MNEGIAMHGHTSNRIFVFDLDDTLIISDAKIKVLDVETGKVIKELTPAQYNYYVQKGNTMLNFDDFKDFGILKKAKLTKYMLLLKQEYKKGTHICILTAREKSDMIRNFFLYHGIDINPQLVIAIGDPKWNLYGATVAEKKKDALERLVNLGYNDFTFFDDNEDNLKIAKSIESNAVKIKTVKV
jgi:FMN phosphatase YigB (HAD superfamily)